MSSLPTAGHPFRSGPAWPLARTLLLAALLACLGACGGKPDADADGAQAEAKADDATARDDTSGKDGKVGKDGKQKANPAVPVEVATVARRSLSASYSGTATLEAPNEAQVVAKTSGVLLKLMAEEGDRVRAGQVLAKIDPARTRLEVQRAEATLRKLESEFRRSTELFERKLVAADAHERLRFDIATQRAAWEIAKLELSYTDITAPIGGVIARRMVKEGNLVPLNAPLFQIVDTDALEAVLNVPERELATMQSGLPVTMQVDARPGVTFSGTIDRVSPVVDSGSGTFRVTAAFEAKDALKPGMFGRIDVVYDRRNDVLTVPRSALLEGEGEAAVFAVRDGKAVRTGIALGHVNGGFAEIRAGLTEGDQVVTVGKVTLRDGAEIDIVNAPPADGGGQVAQSAATSGSTASSE